MMEKLAGSTIHRESIRLSRAQYAIGKEESEDSQCDRQFILPVRGEPVQVFSQIEVMLEDN